VHRSCKQLIIFNYKVTRSP